MASPATSSSTLRTSKPFKSIATPFVSRSLPSAPWKPPSPSSSPRITGPQPSPGPRKLHLHPRPSRPLRPRRRQPRGRRRFRPRPHLDRTGPQPPAPYHLRTAHPPLHRKERSRASNAPNRAQSAVEQAEEKARLLVQLAEYEDRHGRNYDPSNDFPPESRPLGFVFSKSAVLGASSSVNASNRPKSSTGAATVNLTTRNPMTHPPPNNALSAA